jgi:hypothetical protein
MLARQVREPATLKASREPTVVDCKKAAVDSNGQSAEGGTPKSNAWSAWTSDPGRWTRALDTSWK